MRQISLYLLFVVGVLTTGCGPKLIPGMNIELADTPDNRALLVVLEKFQQAFEKQDVDALFELASAKFYETSGSSDTKNHYDYEGIRKHFSEHFNLVEKCTLNITLKDMVVEEDQATIDYRFVSRYLMKLPSGEKWQLKDDINRMKLAKEAGQWKVLSGM